MLPKLVYLLTSYWVRIFQDSLNNAGRHLLDHVDSIVHEKVVDDVLKLLIGEGLDKLLLDIRVKIRECVRSQLLRQAPKGYGKLLYLKFRECSGDISFVLFAEYRSKVVQLLLVDQFFYFLFDEFFLHLTHRLSLYS